MIRADKISICGHTNDKKTLVKVDLVADNSLEVESIGTNAESIIGLSSRHKLAFGSTCFTTTMEFGILDSTGNWRFE